MNDLNVGRRHHKTDKICPVTRETAIEVVTLSIKHFNYQKEYFLRGTNMTSIV